MKRIEQTAWAKAFQRECPGQYDKALQIVEDLDLYVVVKMSTEIETGGHWAIVAGGTDFWLDAKKTKREALALCKKMGWRVSK